MKYKTINIPDYWECHLNWYVPEHAPKVIEYIERQNPNYEFLQFVTREGNGGYSSFALLKEKEK